MFFLFFFFFPSHRFLPPSLHRQPFNPSSTLSWFPPISLSSQTCLLTLKLFYVSSSLLILSFLFYISTRDLYHSLIHPSPLLVHVQQDQRLHRFASEQITEVTSLETFYRSKPITLRAWTKGLAIRARWCILIFFPKPCGSTKSENNQPQKNTSIVTDLYEEEAERPPNSTPCNPICSAGLQAFCCLFFHGKFLLSQWR